MQKNVIIVAGGSGKRMAANIPKQFLLLKEIPILQHTIQRFLNYNNEINIVLVLPEKEIEYWKSICKKYNFKTNYKIIKGGAERFFSVKNALSEIASEGYTGIHDGVRPLVSIQTIATCFNAAKKFNAVVPVLDMVESVRRVAENKNFAVNRTDYKLVQTPQVFKTELIKKAYNQDYNSDFTDDARVIESIGQKVFIVDGNRENIKITSPTDLKIAEVLINEL